MAMKTPTKSAVVAAELEQFIRDEDRILQSTRSYQTEMFEESLKRNIIVAMDTGSGKTHIAILRIRAQLEKHDGKISWFLVPGVALGQQQFDVLKSALPPVNMQFMAGSSGIDKWSNREAWNKILGAGDAVFVSTHQVLLDALTHGFVKMDRIGLMVFDEAHHCTGYHPANRIMQEFYHQRLAKGLYVPHILGLTASPITKADPNQLSVIEGNLNALARTPIVHRGDLLKYVHVPKLRSVIYNEAAIPAVPDKQRTPPETAGSLPEIAAPLVARIPELDIDLASWFDIPGILPEDLYPDSTSRGQNNKRPADQPLNRNGGLRRKITSYESVNALTGELMASVEPNSECESFDPITGGVVVHDSTRTSVELSTEEFEQIDPKTGEPISATTGIQIAPTQNNAERAASADTSMALESLQQIYAGMHVRHDSDIGSNCQEHVKQLLTKAQHLLFEFGSWATDWFIGEAVRHSLKHSNTDQELFDDDQEFGCIDGIQLHLRNTLKAVALPTDLGPVEERITPKVAKLLEVLLSEYVSEKEGFSGLVFVEQRAGVAALAEIINCHPETKEFFKTGTMVGSSKQSKRTRFQHELSGRTNALPQFRNGEKNLVIATSVIEEGLDIRDCHLVVCFTPPHNLKSFVQRRGRARRVQSSYVIMYATWERHRANEFEAMEKEMVKRYSDTTREIADVAIEIKEEGQDRQVCIESTGALLTLENSVAHLYHFCATLPSQEFVDLRPEFKTTRGKDGLWISEVVLPNSIHPDIRRFTSSKAWKSSKWAKRDVAFEAYLKLHSLKLVDDHLMPLVKMELQSLKETEKRLPKATVEEQMDIWRNMGEHWNTRKDLYLSVIKMTFPTGESVGVQLLLPVILPHIDNLRLLWSVSETVIVSFGRPTKIRRSPNLLKRAKNATFTLLDNMHGRRMEKDNFDFPYLFLPQYGDGWDNFRISQMPASETFQADLDVGVLRDKNDPHGASYIHGRWRKGLRPEELSKRLGREVQRTIPVIEAQRLTRRRDFLHPEAGYRKSERTVLLLPEHYIVASLPWRYSRLALLLPFAIDRCEKALLAEDLKHRLGLEWLPTQMTVQALTASSARDPSDYQRLEFLGDSVLKLLTSVALVDEHPLWHEGYLSGAKDRIVSNAASSKHAIVSKLSKWIITRSFTGLKWKPHYITMPREEQKSKSISTKTLADVVEALIGVSYIHSGYEGATACCRVFSLGLTWLPLEQRIINLVSTASSNASKFVGTYPPYFRDLERILGYTFVRPALLLEAVTHLSYGADSQSTSYQRLEFLGDALLDMVVVNRLYSMRGESLSHIDMHHLKSCCVNAGFLAYLCISASVEVDTTVLASKTVVEKKRRSVSLHKFLRHSHGDIPRADAACLRRYQKLRNSIQCQLEEADEYPWVSLAELAAPKHISDIVESLIAAIWVDSSGSFTAVEAFVEKLGIFKVLDHLVKDNVESDHPMSRFGMYVANGGKLGVVKYHVENDEGGRGYRCDIEVNGEVVARVDGGVSASHVKTWAANIGLMEMKERDRKKKGDRMVVDGVRVGRR